MTWFYLFLTRKQIKSSISTEICAEQAAHGGKRLQQKNIALNIERQSAVGTLVLADGLPLYFCFRQQMQKPQATDRNLH
ncbi:MAG: hypothetical protein LUC35_09045 [Clostridiales bacterium]|nr:hypothetical protein [Clostridiales bacterium]